MTGIMGEDRKKRILYPAVVMFASGFLMYVLAILPILIKRGLPFFYYGDYNVQQIPFYILAHRAVRSGQILWNWNVDLGGSMAGDFSFYLWGSPFFWITTLFPEKAIPYLMPFLMALKYAIAALCGYLYIRRYVHKYEYAMIGGYLYAFSGFNACNIVFNHFTDSVCFFPLYLLLFEKLMSVKTRKDGRLILSGTHFVRFSLMTAFMSIVNYYFFFGQVLFFVIYFVVRYLKKGEFADKLIRFLRAFFSGSLGVLLAGFFLAQAFAGVSGNTRLSNVLMGYDMLVYPSGKLIWDILKSLAMLPDIIGKGTLFYTGTVKNASLAAYIPMFGISGVVAFFLTFKKNCWQKKLTVLFLIMAVIPVFNSAFSLFNKSYYARWFYIPVLIMALETAMVMQRGKSLQMKKGIAAACIFFLFFVGVYLLPTTDENGNITFMSMSDNSTIFVRDMVFTAVLLLMLVFIGFILPKNRDFSRVINSSSPFHRNARDMIILLMVVIACIISTGVPIVNGSSIISDRGKAKWQEQMLDNRVEVDTDFFARGEVDSTSTNYDMVWGIPSIHCFLSTVPSEIFDFLSGACGITRTVETNIPVERAGVRAIVSARYYFENAEITKNRVFYNEEGTDGYAFLENTNGFDVFENLNFIPMGFAYDSYILESEWDELDKKDHDYDLVRVLILPDDIGKGLGSVLNMRKLDADYLREHEMSYLEFTRECTKRAGTSCTRFDISTHGFEATTAPLKKDSLLFFSVPCRKGFSCTVDGTKAPVFKADYGLMAIPVSKGIHEIKVTYSPEGRTEGLVMTFAGGVVLLAYALLIKSIKKSD